MLLRFVVLHFVCSCARMQQSRQHSSATSLRGWRGVVGEVLATAYVRYVLAIRLLIFDVVDGVLFLARTRRGRQSRLLCLSCRGARGLFSLFSFEFKSPKGSGSAKPRGHWKLPVSNSPRDEAVTAHSAPDCVSTHLFGFPAGGAEIWPPLGVCRTSKYVLGMSGSRQFRGRKGDGNLQS